MRLNEIRMGLVSNVHRVCYVSTTFYRIVQRGLLKLVWCPKLAVKLLQAAGMQCENRL